MTPCLPLRGLRSALTVLVLVGGGLWGSPEGAAAQGQCRFLPGTRSAEGVTLAGGSRIAYVGGPRISCTDGVRIFADSAVAYSAQNLTFLMGNVRFYDATRELRSDQARYFSQQARLQAQGNLFVKDTAQGSIIENGDMVYLRAGSIRDEDQITVRTWTDGIRPTATLYMKPGRDTLSAEGEGPEDAGARRLPALRDSSSISMQPGDSMLLELPPPPEPDTTPYLVTGNEIFLQGSRYFRSVGNVEIVRDSIHAYGEVAEFDELAGRILIEQNARVESSSYDLVGRTINIGMEDGAMRDLRAVRDGVLTGDDLTLTAPFIKIFLTDGTMERLVATPLEPDADSVAAGVPVDSTLLARPLAVAERFNLVADSLDVLAPGEVLERIIAVGAARGESHARDSLNVEILPEVARSDWLEGDTVIATFVQVQVVDTNAVGGVRDDYRLRQLEAKSGASSLYRMASSDSTTVAGVDPPAVHYVIGDAILIVLLDGEVDHMDVQGQARGWHFEALRAAADTLVADSLVLDSLALDTLAADTLGPDTTSLATPSAPPAPAAVRRGGGSATPSRKPDPFHRSRRPW